MTDSIAELIIEDEYINITKNAYTLTSTSTEIDTDTEGNTSIITTYDAWKDYAFEEFELSLSEKDSDFLAITYDNMWGNNSLKMEFPIGANAQLYIIIGIRNDKPELLFQEIVSGLIVSNIDSDSDLELISNLEGYFYDNIKENLYLYNVSIPDDISQMLWDEQNNKAIFYYKDGFQRTGVIDTANLRVLLE